MSAAVSGTLTLPGVRVTAEIIGEPQWPALSDTSQLRASSMATSSHTVWNADPNRDLLPIDVMRAGTGTPLASELPRAAGILATHKGSGPHIEAAASELIRLAGMIHDNVGSYRFTRYDVAPGGEPPGLPYNPPWHSALGNAFLAVMHMHLSVALDDPSQMDVAHKYLIPITTPMLSSTDDAGFLWLQEIADDHYADGIGIFNGHFTALNILNEWRLRTGSTEFVEIVHRALDTFKHYRPLSLVNDKANNHFCDYAATLPGVPDYGPVRAVNHARGAADIRSDLEPVAVAFEQAWTEWNA